jgi:predicted ATPase
VGRAARHQRLLAQEQDAAAVYRALARQRQGEEREILLALARAESATPRTGRQSLPRPRSRDGGSGCARGC